VKVNEFDKSTLTTQRYWIHNF